MSLIPSNITFESIGHERPVNMLGDFIIENAFSPDYVAEDLGKGYDLTVTLLGYQLDTNAVNLLIEQLNKHVLAVHFDRMLIAENGIKK